MSKRIEKMRKVSKMASAVVWGVQVILAFTVVMSIFNWVMYSGEYRFGFILTGISSLLGVAGLIFMCFIILPLLKSLRNGRTPFEEKNVKRLKRVSLILGTLAVLQVLTDVVSSSLVIPITPPDAQGLSVAIQTVSFHYASLLMFILGLIVYCVAFAFQYGAELQQQSDETM